jgi:hypothetical protein
MEDTTMFSKKALVAALITAGTLGAVATPSGAQVDIQLNFAPPAPRYEVVPAPRAGYVWAPGHWQWRGNSHVWVGGSWEPARAGYVYRSPSWVERNGRWQYQPSRWDRDGDGIPNNQDRTPRGRGTSPGDRDGDGVPNSRDRTPDGGMRDRDGDGVPNRYDPAPGNPRR